MLKFRKIQNYAPNRSDVVCWMGNNNARMFAVKRKNNAVLLNKIGENLTCNMHKICSQNVLREEL
jgi:hypothetical protein